VGFVLTSLFFLLPFCKRLERPVLLASAWILLITWTLLAFFFITEDAWSRPALAQIGLEGVRWWFPGSAVLSAAVFLCVVLSAAARLATKVDEPK
jgi:hypothetical protein